MNSLINRTQLNRLRSLINKNKDFIDKQPKKESDDKKFSMALSMSVLMEYLSLNQVEAYNSLTDEGGDNKIDAFYYDDDENELSDLIIVQSKYKHEDGANKTFEEDDIKLCISNCKKFLKGDNFQTTGEKLQKKILEYRQILKDNDSPSINIKLFFVTNGVIHEGHKELQEINESYENNISTWFIDATSFGHIQQIDSGTLKINIKDQTTDKTDSIFNVNDDLYSGSVVSCTLQNLMEFYKSAGEDQLLTSNVRYHVKNSNVNKEISQSFQEDPVRFCYLNNGITIICSSFTFGNTGQQFTNLIMNNPSIVNGGQTISTIYNLFKSSAGLSDNFNRANILVRVYKAPSEYGLRIAKATNSQNPISLVDLKANDKNQKVVKNFFSVRGIGLITKQGEDIAHFDNIITNEFLLQIFASLYKDDPTKAKLSKATIFKKYYEEVFNEKTDETICKKLFRCYQIGNFLLVQNERDKSVVQNAFYSIIYTMKRFEKNVSNENIPDDHITEHFTRSFNSAYNLITEIIEQKQEELKTKFSMNNLFR